MESTQDKEICNFTKIKQGVHDDRKWLLCKYKGRRFLFTEEVIEMLKLNLESSSFNIPKEHIVVAAKENSLQIVLRTPLKTMKSFMSLKHKLHEGLNFSELITYLEKSSLNYCFEKSMYGEYMKINYGPGFARDIEDQIKVFAGNSISEIINKLSLKEFLSENKRSIICKSFLSADHKKEVLAKLESLKEDKESKEKIEYINKSNYHRFYIRKIKNSIKNHKEIVV